MFELPELPKIFPLGAILFDFLFLLVAIPIEAYVLNARLSFDKRTSAYYSIAINLFSSTIGWVTFFLIEPFLTIQFKSELISYVFFYQFQAANTQNFMILLAFIIFFATLLLKFFLLRLMLLTLAEPKQAKEEEVSPYPRRNSRRGNKAKLLSTNLFTTILIANSLSYSAITIILIISANR
ncbi:MAG: filament integrity protein FraC [Heteroscytonema crispum UTEX LB 1556]